MNIPILRTKISTPQLGENFIARPNLYEKLNEGLKRKLMLIAAPAGFGKTTLVSSWLSETDQARAWLSLDEGDSDPNRFWTYLIKSLQTVDAGLGEEAYQILNAPQLRSLEPVVISLINDISRRVYDLTVILDDYHVVESEHINDSMNFLLENLPENLHIVLLTRVDPPLSLARLRAHGQMVEVRANDLKFSLRETEILLNDRMGLNLNPKQVEALHSHTESWVVGLQLAALSLKGQSSYDQFIAEFTGGHKFILDYLIEEVLDNLPDEQRRFMLQTSFLPKFNEALCQAVTENPNSRQLLEDIRKSNLFLIPLDSDGNWFRYHHLFAEVLYALLEQQHPDEINALHQKAAAWFDREGFPGEAVDHILRSGDKIQSREMVLKHWLPVLHKGEIATVLRWLDALPGGENDTDPVIPLARCWALFISGRNMAIKPYLDQAEAAFEHSVKEGLLKGPQNNYFAAQLEMMRSVVARSQGNPAASIAHVEEAANLMPTELLEGIGTQWLMLAAARGGAGDFGGAVDAYDHGISLSFEEGNLIGAYGCTYGKAMYLIVQGRLQEAEKLCKSSIEVAVKENHENLPAVGALYVALARVKLEEYQLEESESFLTMGLRIARPGGFVEAVRTGRHLKAHLSAARGKLNEAMDIFRETNKIIEAMHDPFLRGELNWEWAKLCLKACDLDGAREKLESLRGDLSTTQHAHLQLAQNWLLPRILSDEARYDEAQEILEKSIRYLRASNSKGELIRLLALHAVVLKSAGKHESAINALKEALELSAPEGYIWRWLDAGPSLEPLLSEISRNIDASQPMRSHLEALLEVFHDAFAQSQSKVPPGLLTTRELEIVRLISKGYSNPEIAAELVVTINTIKKHTSNIYTKLDVSSRTQAIARAHEMGLL